MINRLGRALGGGRLFREKRGSGPPRWTLDWKAADGTRRRQSLSTDRRVAERLRAEVIRERDLQVAGLGGVEGQSLPLTQIRDAFLEDLVNRSSVGHSRNVRARLARVLKDVRAPRVRDLTPHLLMQYRSRRIAAGVSHSTVNHEIRHVKTMLSWAMHAGLIRENPVAALQHLRVGQDQVRRKRRALSDEEIEQFLRAAADDDRAQQAYISALKTIDGRTKAAHWVNRLRGERIPQSVLWSSFLETGARYYELVCTTWADLDLARRSLTLRGENTKSGRQRVLPLREELICQMLAVKQVHERVLGRAPKDADRIFLTPEAEFWKRDSKSALRIFNRVLKGAGIAKCDDQGQVLDVHCLRHTFASRLARAGVSLVAAQRMLGHSDPALTSKVYTHLGVDDLRAEMERVDYHDGGEARSTRLRAV